MTVRWFDNHCHLDGDDDPQALVAEAQAGGVAGMVTVGTSTERSAACLALAAGLPGVWATAGVHPHDAVDGTDALVELVAAHRGDPTLVAIGECGLDYHYDHSPRTVQQEAFARQIALAHRVDLPLVIHTREAWDDTFRILGTEGVPRRTVFHCFTGGPDEAERRRRHRRPPVHLGHRHVPRRNRPARRGGRGPARPPDGGDRFALPGAGAPPGPSEPPGPGGAGG